MRCEHLIWGIICHYTTTCSFRILKKAGEWRLRRFVFVVVASQIGLKIHRIFQTSKYSDNPSTETNNTSYESTNNQLFGARRMRAWHHHGGATPTSRKTVCYFSFWGRGGQEGWFFQKKNWLGQMSASHKSTDTVFVTYKCIFEGLISICFHTPRDERPCIQ